MELNLNLPYFRKSNYRFNVAHLNTYLFDFHLQEDAT